MAAVEERSERRRREVWQQLRAQVGTRRRADDDSSTSRLRSGKGRYTLRFLRLREAAAAEVEEEARARNEITEEHVRELVETVRSIRHSDRHPLEPREEGEEQPMLTSERRRELLAEIATEQFRNNMQEWMNSVRPDHELSSTPLEDLERLRNDARYRRSILQAMLQSTELDVDALELHIRAVRASDREPPDDGARAPGSQDD